MGSRIALSAASLLTASLLIAGDASRTSAQQRPAVGVIDGVVTDTGLVALADVTVSMLGSGLKVVTGTSGRFQILAVPPGQYILMVRRIGFAPVSSAVQVTAGDTLRASFALERFVTALDTVKVAAKRLSMRMAEFEYRRKLGEGQFLTLAEIEKRNAPFLSELFRTFLGVDIGVGIVTNRRVPSAYGFCPYQFFIDGVAIPTPGIDRDLPTPKEIAGIEVYSGPATIPLQYKTVMGHAFCGVILLWTRDGS